MSACLTPLKRVLVTGATGFVGAHLVALLVRGGVHVDAFTRGPVAVPAGAVGVPGDLLDIVSLTEALAQHEYDAIFHLAGLNAAAGSVALYQTNVVGTATLLQAMRRANRPAARLVVVGSSAEYGASPDDPITEESPTVPVGDYGVSKLAATRMALLLHAATGQAVMVARPFNVIGPGQCAGLLHADVARQVVEIENGGRAPHLRLRDLSGLRDFVDVRDIAAGLVAVAEHGAAGQIYNLCTEKSVPAGMLVDALLSRARLSIILEAASGPRPAADVAAQRGSFAKIAKASGWAPQIGLEKSLTDTLNYWRKAANPAQIAVFDHEIPEAFQQ